MANIDSNIEIVNTSATNFTTNPIISIINMFVIHILLLHPPISHYFPNITIISSRLDYCMLRINPIIPNGEP